MGVKPDSAEVKKKKGAEAKELIELIGDQKERQEQLEKRLDRLQELIAEVSATPERRASLLAEPSKRMLSRAQTYKVGSGGRSGSKAKPSGKIFGSSGKVLDGTSLEAKRSRSKKSLQTRNNQGKFSPAVSISSEEGDAEGSSAILRKLMA